MSLLRDALAHEHGVGAVRDPPRSQGVLADQAGAAVVHALMEIDPPVPRMIKEQRKPLLETKQQLEAQAPRAAAPYPFAHEPQDGLPDKAERAVDGRALAPDGPAAAAASPSSG